MQETQCDKFGVSGGLGEPRFGLKLWLGSADLIDDNSSKSWVLFRDLPYLAIVMGVDLCMFMSVGIALDKQKKNRWRDESRASAAAGASVPRMLKGIERGGTGRGLRGERVRSTHQTAAAGHLVCSEPDSRGVLGRRQLGSFCYPQSRQRFAESSHF